MNNSLLQTRLASYLATSFLLIFTLSFGLQTASAQTTFEVASAQDITNALQSAAPGDTLLMKNGVWTDQQIEFAGNGTALKSIVLRAETPGGVVLTGTSSLKISGSHLHVDGLHFKDGNAMDSGHVVQFRGSLGQATNSRFYALIAVPEPTSSALLALTGLSCVFRRRRNTC